MIVQILYGTAAANESIIRIKVFAELSSTSSDIEESHISIWLQFFRLKSSQPMREDENLNDVAFAIRRSYANDGNL